MNIENGSLENNSGKSSNEKEHLSSQAVEESREKWSNKAEFVLSCIGVAVGVGNVWRFPYLAYKNGGGSFLIAYTILIVLVGKPHFFAELALGQFSSQGSVTVWRCFPIAKGIGIAMLLISGMISVYYNVIMAYTLYYIAQSFRAEVPWNGCQKWWGSNDNCYVRASNQTSCWEISEKLYSVYASKKSNTSSVMNLTWKYKEFTVPIEEYTRALDTCSNGTQTASEQFWEHYVLDSTSGIDNIGTIKWDLALTLLLCWIIMFLCLVKGIKSSGKVVYFTATFPYVILMILLVYGCSLPGAVEGLKYFFIPEWKKLLEIEVWRAAAEMLLFSLSIGNGCLVTYASYNEFGNKLYRDAILVSTLDFLTSLIAGVVIFSVLGNMSVEMGVDISKVAKGGQGLAFVTYPEALARLPVPQLWSVLFFFMLLLLAIDSEFSYVEAIFTSLYDKYPHLKNKKTPITFAFCMFLFLLGLPCVTQGGQYVLNLMDTYAGGYAELIIATIEISALMWGYGADRFADDLNFMLGFTPGLYWRICWKYLSPTILWFVLIYSLGTHSIIKYAGGTPYPWWAEGLGWLLLAVSVLQVPLWAIVQFYKYRKDKRSVFQPDEDWGPKDPYILLQYKSRNLPFSEDKSVDKEITNIGMLLTSEEITLSIQSNTNDER